MRFCPFCSAENADESTVCNTCGRRLPPLPPRRARNAPPTGVQLPARPKPASNPPPPMQRSGGTMPMIPDGRSPAPPADAGEAPGQPTPGAPGGPPMPGAPMTSRAARPSQPPPIAAERPARSTQPPPIGDRAARTSQPPPIANAATADAAALRNAISPGPAAQRREVPPDDARDPVHARRRTDVPADDRSRPPSNPPPIPPSGPRARPVTAPPTTRSDASGRLPSSGVGFDDDFNTNISSPAYPDRPPTYDGGGETIPSAGAFDGLGGATVPSAPAYETGPSPVVKRPPTAPPPTPASRAAPAPSRSSTPPASRPLAVPPSSRPPLASTAGRSMPSSAGTSASGSSARAPLPPPVMPEPLVPASRSAMSTPTGLEPPPTRIQRPDALADRPFTPPKVDPVPEIPEPGLISAARYTVHFAKARFQRRGAIKTLGADIKQDTEALDQVLGALGRQARGAKVDGRVFSAENQSITEAEERAGVLAQEHGDVDGRKAEESSKFLDIEKERNTKLGEAERAVDETQKELAHLEGQRRGLRDKRKELERRQKAYLKGAEDAERQSSNAQLGESRQELRRTAEQHRKEAAALEPERQDIDRRLASLDRPINEATARLDAAKAELDAAKRSLADAREGHTHRLAELDAEQKRKAREIALAEAEIARRLVTLGTLVNLNRIDDPQFTELYQRIDRLRGAITARTTEIEKLTAEREAYDKGTLTRGIATILGALVAFIALISILRIIL